MNPIWYGVYLYIAGSAFLLSFFLTPLMRRLSYRWNLLDRPEPRKIHTRPMPLLGGLGIFLSFNLVILFNLGLLIFCRFNPEIQRRIPAGLGLHIPGAMSVLPRLAAILFGGTAMFVLGLIDDKRRLRAGVKLLIQLIIGIILVLAGVRASLFVPQPIFGGLVTLLWVVGITNAFNLLDNMDGLSAGVALVSSLIFFAVTFFGGQLFVAAILAVLIGVLAGFLKYNFYPARIFMGDSGSLFIGYTLSVLTIVSTYYSSESPTTMAIIAPLLILGVPIFDTLTVCGIRLKEHRPLFVGDQNHFSHRLVALGMRPAQAVLLIYLVSFGVGISALLLNRVGIVGGIIILIQAAVIFTIIGLLERSARARQR